MAYYLILFLKMVSFIHTGIPRHYGRPIDPSKISRNELKKIKIQNILKIQFLSTGILSELRARNRARNRVRTANAQSRSVAGHLQQLRAVRTGAGSQWRSGGVGAAAQRRRDGIRVLSSTQSTTTTTRIVVGVVVVVVVPRRRFFVARPHAAPPPGARLFPPLYLEPRRRHPLPSYFIFIYTEREKRTISVDYIRYDDYIVEVYIIFEKRKSNKLLLLLLVISEFYC